MTFKQIIDTVWPADKALVLWGLVTDVLMEMRWCVISVCRFLGSQF